MSCIDSSTLYVLHFLIQIVSFIHTVSYMAHPQSGSYMAHPHSVAKLSQPHWVLHCVIHTVCLIFSHPYYVPYIVSSTLCVLQCLFHTLCLTFSHPHCLTWFNHTVSLTLLIHSVCITWLIHTVSLTLSHPYFASYIVSSTICVFSHPHSVRHWWSNWYGKYGYSRTTFWSKSVRKFTRIYSKTDSLRKKIAGILEQNCPCIAKVTQDIQYASLFRCRPLVN